MRSHFARYVDSNPREGSNVFLYSTESFGVSDELMRSAAKEYDREYGYA